jgi:parallel beta-helix repeat protein
LKKNRIRYILLLVSIALVSANLYIREVRAETPIYIKADGNIDPPTAPLERNGEIFTLKEDFVTNTNGIIVERNGITLDGADHKLTGISQQSQKGIILNNVQQVTVKNLRIESFDVGIMFWNSSHTTIIENTILNNLNQGIGFGGHIGSYYNKDNLITQNFFSGNNLAMGPFEDGDLVNSVITQNQIIGNNGGLGIGTEGHSWINVTINDNIIADNLGAAIYFVSYKAPTWGITISNNKVTNNGGGIELDLWGVPDILIIDNIIADNMGIGLSLEGTCNSTISGNLIKGNFGGFELSHGYGDVSTAKNNVISENTMIMNTHYGIFLYGAPENQLINNVIANNSNGLVLDSMFFESYEILSNNNLIKENQINQNSNSGIQIIQSNNNLVYQNTFIDNSIQVYSEDSINIWDNGENAGNFWSDYSGVDENHDGIGDTPYIIDVFNQDMYPLMMTWVPNQSIRIEELIKNIETMNLPRGTEKGLVGKLNDALKFLDKESEKGAIHKLMNFIDQVEAQREKKLTNEHADQLTSEAQIIIGLIIE